MAEANATDVAAPVDAVGGFGAAVVVVVVVVVVLDDVVVVVVVVVAVAADAVVGAADAVVGAASAMHAATHSATRRLACGAARRRFAALIEIDSLRS